MAGNSILSGIKTKGPEASLNVDDVQDSELYMSPGEAEIFDQYNQQRNVNPSTGALPVTAYYPEVYRNTAVGSYGGSEVGNLTLFAPGGGLVPLGMMDAREQAIQRAADNKMRNVDEFRKQFKAPTSNLTNINQNLTDEYIGHVQGSWQSALKKAGGDATKAQFLLQNDPEFWKKEKSYRDLAKLGDDIAAKTAKDELDIRSGKFTPTPKYQELQRKLYTAMNPANPEFKDLANIYRTMQIERDFSDSFEEVTKKMVADQSDKVWSDLNDPEFMKVYSEKVKSWSPEQKEGIVKTLQDNFYPQSDYWTPEKIKENVNYRLRGKTVDKTLNVSQKRDDSGDKYSVADISPEQDNINGNVLQTGGTVREGKYPTFDRLTLRKPVNVVIPAGTKAVDLLAGGVRNRDIGNIQAEIGGIYNAVTYKSAGSSDKEFDGMMLDEQNAARKGAVVTPMVSVTYKRKNAEGDDEVVSTHVPLASVENALVGKKGENKEVIEEIKKRAAEKTKLLNQHVSSGTEAAAEPAPATDNKEDLRKKYKY